MQWRRTTCRRPLVCSGTGHTAPRHQPLEYSGPISRQWGGWQETPSGQYTVHSISLKFFLSLDKQSAHGLLTLSQVMRDPIRTNRNKTLLSIYYILFRQMVASWLMLILLEGIIGEISVSRNWWKRSEDTMFDDDWNSPRNHNAMNLPSSPVVYHRHHKQAPSFRPRHQAALLQVRKPEKWYEYSIKGRKYEKCNFNRR